MRLKSVLSSLAFAVAIAEPAAAHSGLPSSVGLTTGFLHPLGGLDHLLAMFAVGLLAAQSGKRALWLVPAAFVAMMTLGALLDFAAIELPGVEYAIALSLVAIALPVALALGMPAMIAMIYVGFFALFHGHAHGSELPADAAMVSYVVGFAAATALIHAAGIGFGIVSKGVPARAAAAAVAAIGLMLVIA